MSEGLLLGAAPYVVDGLVGEAHDVEPVEDQFGVEAGADAGGVTPERVDRRHADEAAPLEGLGLEPVGDDLAGPADGHVEEQTTVEIDQAGHVDRRPVPGARQEPGLVHAQRGHASGAGRVVDQRQTVVDDRCPGAVPADPEGPGRPGDRPAIGADETADLEPGSFAQHLARTDRRVLLGPCLALAVLVGAAPDPLRPDEHDRPAEDRQVPDPHLAAAVPNRPGPARRAAHQIGGGLDLDHHSSTISACASTRMPSMPNSAVTTSLPLTRQGPRSPFCNSRQVAESRGP